MSRYLDQFKYQDGPLKGQFRQTLQTLRLNLMGSAYLATPGAPIRVAGVTVRPTTVDEAAEFRPKFEAYARELDTRDPEGFAMWRTAYLDWRAGDLEADIPSPESFRKEI
ncbi:hypothetical protein [Streptomyces sp. H27-H5]|uniref:hypothetical protein n=1 Tax=Streptomyces sp. H27-H5 TaxID=2996460 RepID=UPI00226E9AA6|nr:hypothetical protein [Streptomyces sp. H27-H5]MCY0955825.1 hypothetical protein [Streptomyces sp. H27-H5]